MKFARLSLVLAIAAAVVLLSSGPGYRLDLWELGTGFQMMRWAAYGGLGAAALALLFVLIPKTRRGQLGWLVPALAVGLAVAYVPWQGLQQARSVPPIHDITTDPVNPPEFESVLPVRGEGTNPTEYRGEEIARQQREAYPDIQPRLLADDPATAFRRALETATAMGWEIVAAEPETGRIEATATTFWYGFKDDVVIRITETESGSRIDMRSTSRVGTSDVGANAARISAYFKRLEKRSG